MSELFTILAIRILEMEQLLSRPKPPTQGFKSIAPRNGPIHIQQWLLKKVLLCLSPFLDKNLLSNFEYLKESPYLNMQFHAQWFHFKSFFE
jgi:hypothetical protein